MVVSKCSSHPTVCFIWLECYFQLVSKTMMLILKQYIQCIVTSQDRVLHFLYILWHNLAPFFIILPFVFKDNYELWSVNCFPLKTSLQHCRIIERVSKGRLIITERHPESSMRTRVGDWGQTLGLMNLTTSIVLQCCFLMILNMVNIKIF